jgi:hypothetical protein
LAVATRTEDGILKLELNDQERRAVSRALAERKARLVEQAGDTTQTQDARRSASLEVAAIISALRKLHPDRSSELDR